MNLLAATTLSTQRKARSYYRAQRVLGWPGRILYKIVVEEMHSGDKPAYTLRIHHATYLEETEKTTGPATFAPAHFEKTMSYEDLKVFLEERGFTLDDTWWPAESED